VPSAHAPAERRTVVGEGNVVRPDMVPASRREIASARSESPARDIEHFFLR
jgi:hypothetical protein